MPVGERVPNHFYITLCFHSKQAMIPLACVRDPAYIWDPASISTNYIDPRPVSGTWRLCRTRLLPEVLRYCVSNVQPPGCMDGRKHGHTNIKTIGTMPQSTLWWVEDKRLTWAPKQSIVVKQLLTVLRVTVLREN